MMKEKLLILWLFFFSFYAGAQIKLPVFPDSIFTTYYHQRASLFSKLPSAKGDILFIGNSITDGGEWAELFADLRIKNRGISGDISAGVINRFEEVVQRKPARIFLLIGVNDLARNITPDSLMKNILLLADFVKQESPSTRLFVQSVLPVNDVFGRFGGHTGKGELIRKVNESLRRYSEIKGYVFIDLFGAFSDTSGKLRTELTNDGLHLNGKGYLLWKHLVFPYVYSLQEKPSLLPLPERLNWTGGYFPLYECRTILINDDRILREARLLETAMEKKGLRATMQDIAPEDEVFIQLKIGKVETDRYEEGYHLEVTQQKVVITAGTPHGIFNGIQTLLQLMRNEVMIDACEIQDQPAFSWRGYMIDVGRNYMSVDLLKQQIDIMARYKLNVFHFHATEDIAWRIAIRQYPQLTAPEHMLRNKGMYYTEAEIKELINYCKERYITFVPEIDMPGHSAAFKRAMKTDMQSDSGMRYVKNILKEFCATYDVPYIHIGADEVKITNKNFVPEVTRYVESLGRKVIGWQPGGNFTESTIRQLWMDDNAHLSSQQHIQFIDSRHLYLNHMDPQESVVTIFNRKIGDNNKGDASLLGGTVCVWHDRAVSEARDVLTMNPVYPGMLAFAEKSWRGGGQSGWIANMDDGDKQQFMNFENRLLENKALYFKTMPFPYVKQSDITWNLFGPYYNGGDPAKIFQIEDSLKSINKLKAVKQVTGGTIVLKHWWAPLIKGAIEKPEENTTWYATTAICSDEDRVKNFWIGFNNISRSPATDSPPGGYWDNKGSTVWINGILISPPHWLHPGQKGNSEIPLIDEGYEYRAPAKIFLKKGWNQILIKAPIGSFKGKDWQNPVKWMFTFSPEG